MKVRKWLCVVTALVMLLGVATLATACSDKKGDTVEVTWYSGRTALRTDDVKPGTKLTSWTPDREGFVFIGWYADQTCDTEFDFDKEIKSATAVYAGWRPEVLPQDTRLWYAIGGGAGTMKASNWQFATEAEKVGEEVKLDENGNATFTVKDGFEELILQKTDKTNVFTLELTLRPSDKFRIITGAYNSDWSGDKSKAEIGLGDFEGFEYAAGTNPNGGTEVTKEDKAYGEVKNDKGEVVFYGGMENGNYSTHMWNAWLADGKDGKYKFTVTVYPGYDRFNTIEWELVEALEPLKETHKMYFVGSIGEDPNSWYDPVASEGTPNYLTKGEDGVTWTGFLTITEDNFVSTWGEEQNGKAWIKVKNEISGDDYGVDGGMSNIPLTEGTWCVTYNSETNKTAYEKCDYYVVGTFYDDTAKAPVNFAVKADVTPALTGSGNTYTAQITVTDVSAIEGFTWLKDKNAVFAIKVVFGSSLGNKDWYGAPDNNSENVYLTAAGTYTVTLTLNGTSGFVTAVAVAA